MCHHDNCADISCAHSLLAVGCKSAECGTWHRMCMIIGSCHTRGMTAVCDFAGWGPRLLQGHSTLAGVGRRGHAHGRRHCRRLAKVDARVAAKQTEEGTSTAGQQPLKGAVCNHDGVHGKVLNGCSVDCDDWIWTTCRFSPHASWEDLQGHSGNGGSYYQ